jgi:asparagine synthase (glutamine-hydrolysing)
MGFSIPLADWLRSDLKFMFEDTVLATTHPAGDFLNMKTVTEMWTKHLSCISDYAAELWAVLFFFQWAKTGGFV